MVRCRVLVALVLLSSLFVPVFGDVVPRDFYVEVSKGNVPGHRIARLTGINEAVGANYEDVISVGGSYVYPVVAARVNVSSTDADDTDGGTGARNVTIEGLDADWVAVSETILLNGQTNVTSILSYIRINDFFVRCAGSSGSNEGVVSVTQHALLLSEIIIDHGHSQYAIYSIPVNTSALAFSAFITSSEDKTVEVELMTHLFGESWHAEVEVFSFRANTVFNVKGFELIPGKSDIRMRAKVGATTGEVGATLNLLLITDAVLHNASLKWAGSGVVDSVPVSVAETLTTTNPENQLMMWVGIIVMIALGMAVVYSRRFRF